MKTTEIINNLTAINVILCKKHKDFYYLGEDDVVKEHYFPEMKRHNEDVVKWLIETIRFRPKDSKLVIYTFNEYIVNHLGLLINSGKIPVDAAKIFIIEKENSVHVSTYDSDGCLENWQFGWFLSNYDAVERCAKLF